MMVSREKHAGVSKKKLAPTWLTKARMTENKMPMVHERMVEHGVEGSSVLSTTARTSA